MPKKTEQPASLKTALKGLEQIVDHLESGELPLEQVINEFKHGVQLARQGQKMLQQAEQRVKILLNNTPDLQLTAFSPENDAL